MVVSSEHITKTAETRQSSTVSCMASKRIEKIVEYWCGIANDEFGFGVIHGLRLAMEALNGKKEKSKDETGN